MVGQAVCAHRPTPVGRGHDADTTVRRQHDPFSEDRQPERLLPGHLSDRHDRLDRDHDHQREGETIEAGEFVDDVHAERRDQGKEERPRDGRGRVDRDGDADPRGRQNPGHGQRDEPGPDASIRRGDAARLTAQKPIVASTAMRLHAGVRLAEVPTSERTLIEPRNGLRTTATPKLTHAARPATAPTRERTSVAGIACATFTARTPVGVVASPVCSSELGQPRLPRWLVSFGSLAFPAERGARAQL